MDSGRTVVAGRDVLRSMLGLARTRIGLGRTRLCAGQRPCAPCWTERGLGLHVGLGMVSRGRFGGLPPCRGWWNPFSCTKPDEATSLGVVATATCGCRSWGITAIKNRWRTRRGDAGASLPDVTALVFASVSSDDFRQVGLGLDSARMDRWDTCRFQNEVQRYGA